MNYLQVGAQYRDARGRVWTVHSFLYDEGRWMVEDPSGDYVHVTTPSVRPRYRGAKDGKFVKAKTFAKGVTLVAAPDATEGQQDGRARSLRPLPRATPSREVPERAALLPKVLRRDKRPRRALDLTRARKRALSLLPAGTGTKQVTGEIFHGRQMKCTRCKHDKASHVGGEICVAKGCDCDAFERGKPATPRDPLDAPARFRKSLDEPVGRRDVTLGERLDPNALPPATIRRTRSEAQRLRFEKQRNRIISSPAVMRCLCDFCRCTNPTEDDTCEECLHGRHPGKWRVGLGRSPAANAKRARIVKLCESGLSQYTVAEMVGVTQGYVSQVITAHRKQGAW